MRVSKYFRATLAKRAADPTNGIEQRLTAAVQFTELYEAAVESGFCTVRLSTRLRKALEKISMDERMSARHRARAGNLLTRLAAAHAITKRELAVKSAAEVVPGEPVEEGSIAAKFRELLGEM